MLLDYKDIIIKHYALGMSGREIAEELSVSKSGVNKFLAAFKECNSDWKGCAPFIYQIPNRSKELL